MSESRVPRPRRFLVCDPRHFAVQYAINPWMVPTAPVDADLASRQWEALISAYRDARPHGRLRRPGARASRHGLRRERRARRRRPGLRLVRSAHPSAPPRPPRTEPGSRRPASTSTARSGERGRGRLPPAGGYILAGTGFRTDARRATRGPGVLRRPGDQPAAGRPALLPPGHRALRRSTTTTSRTTRRRSRRAAARCCAGCSPTRCIATRPTPRVLRPQRGLRRPPRRHRAAGRRPRRPAAPPRLRARPRRPVRAAQGRRRHRSAARWRSVMTAPARATEPADAGTRSSAELIRAEERRPGAQLPPAARGHRARRGRLGRPTSRAGATSTAWRATRRSTSATATRADRGGARAARPAHADQPGVPPRPVRPASARSWPS